MHEKAKVPEKIRFESISKLSWISAILYFKIIYKNASTEILDNGIFPYICGTSEWFFIAQNWIEKKSWLLIISKVLDISLKIFTTPTQPQLNLKVGCDTKITLINPPPPTKTQCQQYLRCYWSNFDQTLKVLGSLDHL